MSINQVRDRYGERPVASGDENRIYLATGAVSLTGNEAAAQTRQQTAEAELANMQNPPAPASKGKKRKAVAEAMAETE